MGGLHSMAKPGTVHACEQEQYALLRFLVGLPRSKQAHKRSDRPILLDLPDDVWVNILLRLSSREVLNMRLTCKRGKSLVSSLITRWNLTDTCTDAALVSVVSCFPHLYHLELYLTPNNTVTQSGLSLINTLPLRSLYITGSPHDAITPVDSRFLEGCNELTSFDWTVDTHYGVQSAPMHVGNGWLDRLIGCRHLQHVHICAVYSVHKNDMHALATLPCLKGLVCGEISADAVEVLRDMQVLVDVSFLWGPGPHSVMAATVATLKTHPALESMCVSLPHCTGLGLQTVATLATLRTLHVRDGQAGPDGLQPIALSTKLHTLNVAYCKMNSGDWLQPISSLVHLQSLDLSGQPTVDASLMGVLSSLPQLTVLNLRGCIRVTSQAVLAISRVLSLHSLCLAACPLLASPALEPLQNLSSLSFLNLSYSYQVREEDIKRLWTHFGGRCRIVAPCFPYMATQATIAPSHPLAYILPDSPVLMPNDWPCVVLHASKIARKINVSC